MSMAIRIARSNSNNDKVAFSGYHGWHDWYLATNLKNNSDLGTLAAKIKDNKKLKNENIVKVITEKSLEEYHFPKAVSLTRKTEKIDNIYHHIGIYCYSIDCLEIFVQLYQSKNEIENRLEQLRALDNNIDINVSLAKSSPIGVDT